MKRRRTRGPVVSATEPDLQTRLRLTSRHVARAEAEQQRKSGSRLAAQRTQGSVTVFLALTFAMIAALLLTIVESCRTVSERLFWQTAVDSSMESLFSQFHRPLWESYRIFGLQYRTDEDLSEEFYDFMKPYLSARDLFPGSIKEESIGFQEHVHVTEGISFEDEVLEYMKYGLLDSMIRFAGSDFQEQEVVEELEKVFRRADESKEIRELQRSYQLDTKDLKTVEDVIAQVDAATRSAEAAHQEAWNALRREDPYDFYSAKYSFTRALTELQQAVSRYTKAADQLAEKVAALRADFNTRSASLSEEGRQAIEAEISEYESYVSRSGDVRAEIEAMPAKADALIAEADRVEQDVDDFEEWLADAWDDDEEDEPDFSYEIRRFYRNAAADWHSFSLIHYGGELSRINAKNKALLDQISDLLQGNLLSLVLPDGAALPSNTAIHDRSPAFPADSTAHPMEVAILGEYALKFFHYYHPGETPKEQLPPSGAQVLELEYLLGGESSDYENLSEYVTKLVALREGMNLIYLYSSPEKRNEARLFVTSFLVATGNPALISVFTFFVLGIWALVQAIQDVKTLLSAGRVPLFHDSSSWSVDISGLLRFGEHPAASADVRKNGLSYRDYLRAFLLGEGLLDQAGINQRMLSRIEKNIRQIGQDPETGFALDECLYALEATVRPDTRHVMYSTGILQMVADTAPAIDYSMEISSYYKYRNDTQ